MSQFLIEKSPKEREMEEKINRRILVATVLNFKPPKNKSEKRFQELIKKEVGEISPEEKSFFQRKQAQRKLANLKTP